MGIREGLMLRQYIDERGFKAEEMKQRAKLYAAQAKGLEADATIKWQDYLQGEEFRAWMRQQGFGPEGAQGQATPGSPAAPRPPASPLESALTRPPAQLGPVAPEPMPELGLDLGGVAPQAPPARTPSMGPVAMPEPTPGMDLSGTSPGQARKQQFGQAPAPAAPVDIEPAPAAPPGVTPAAARTPAAQTLAPTPRRQPAAPAGNLEQQIRAEAQRQGVNPDLAVAVARQESSLNPNAIGDNGASIGLFQLQEGAARDAGIDPNLRHDPNVNIVGGVTYLKQKLQQAGGNEDQALLRYNGGGDPNYVANVRRYMPGGAGERRAPDQRVAGPGAPAAARPQGPAVGGLETPPVAVAPAPAAPPVDPQMVKFDKMRQLGQMMVYFGKEKEGTNWINAANQTQAAYLAQKKQQYREIAALKLFQIQANPGMPPQQKIQLQAEATQALVMADEVTNARQYTELQPVAAGTTMLDPVTRQPAYQSPYRPMNQPEGTQTIHPQPGGAPAKVISPATPKTATPKAPETYGAMSDNELVDITITQKGTPAAKTAQEHLDQRLKYRSETTQGRAAGGTTGRIIAEDEAKRGLPLERAVTKAQSEAYFYTKGPRRVPGSANYGETLRGQERGEVAYVPDEEDQKQVNDLRDLMPTINEISERTQRVYGPGGIFEQFQKEGRGKATTKGAFARFAQSDKDYAVLQRLLQGLPEKIGRAYGGYRGAQTEGDVKRASSLMTQLSPIPDRPEVAYDLLNSIYDVTEQIMRRVLETPGFTWEEAAKRPPRTGQAPAPAPGGQTAPSAGQTPPAQTTPPAGGYVPSPGEKALMDKYGIKPPAQ